jgi:hypothetical protein
MFYLHGAESFLKATRSSASQEIPCILWNPNVNFGIHNCQASVPVLRQINPAHAPSRFLKPHFNIILPSTPEPT